MSGMTFVKLTFRYVQEVRRGKYVSTYYRRAGQRVKIEGEPGSPAWIENYDRIHRSFESPGNELPGRIVRGSMADLIARYRASPEYRRLRPKTRLEYDRAIAFLLSACGDKPAATLPRKFVIKLRNDNQDSPSRANKTIAFLKTLMNFAVDLEWRASNPCHNVKKLKLGEGAKVWTAEQIATFTDKARPHHRIAFELGLNTGQRLGDILAISWSAYDGATVTLKQQKTGAELTIPCTRRLKMYLDSLPRRSPIIVTNADGKPYRRVDSYSNLFGAEIRAMGLSGISFHGLRKTAAAILAEEGCSEREIMALTGHRSTAMVSHYTRQADQKRRAESAVRRLDRAKSVKHQRTKV